MRSEDESFHETDQHMTGRASSLRDKEREREACAVAATRPRG